MILFNSWTQIWRTVVVGALAYLSFVALQRLSGKRTLSKLNGFDLVVTVALGSVLATALLSADVAFAEGLTAFALLMLLQYVATAASVRSARVRRLIKSKPAVLVENGQLRLEEMRAQRVTEDEVFQAVRQSGLGGLDLVAAVVLETDGSLSVIPKSDAGDRGAISAISGEH